MNRDPFERLRAANPSDADRVAPPMATAERIIAGGSGVPGWVVSVAAAALVVVVGGGSLLLFGDRDDAAPIASDDTSTTLTETTLGEPTAPSTVAPSTSSTVASERAGPTQGVVAYFLVDDPTATGASPALVPVVRSASLVEALDLDSPEAAVEALLAGPTDAERESVPAMSTAIPDGTRLLGPIDVVDGVATVDLSPEFVANSGSFSEIARLEQVMYTLTRLPDIDGVRFAIDGQVVDVFGGHGIVLDGPMVRTEFDTALPAILIDSPAHGGAAGKPLVATGTANVFEATVSLALTDADGLILWEGFTTATCGTGCRGEWSAEIPYDVDEPQMGALIAWEASARDGSQTNVREHPVWLVPAGGTIGGPVDTTTTSIVGPTCSGAATPPVLVEQALPAPLASTRSAVFEAAVLCDWEALRQLASSPFTYSFAGGDDPVGYWQELEAGGSSPMWYLAELLNRPFATIDDEEGVPVIWVWPSAHAVAWEDTTVEDREALHPLYDDDDFAAFADFGGYFGYRIGVTESGEWMYFVAGD